MECLQNVRRLDEQGEPTVLSVTQKSKCCWWLVNTSPVHNLYFWAVTNFPWTDARLEPLWWLLLPLRSQGWSPQTCCCNSPSCDVPSLFHFLSRDAPSLCHFPIRGGVHLNGGTWFPKEPRKCHFDLSHSASSREAEWTGVLVDNFRCALVVWCIPDHPVKFYLGSFPWSKAS